MTYFSKLPPRKQTPIRIGFVGFGGLTTLDLTGPLEAFAAARTDDGERCYETVLIGVERKTFATGSGAVFAAERVLKTAPPLDTIIVPGGGSLSGSETCRTIAQWLRARETTTRRIASVSAGIYPLALSGLLDGRHATTHWRLVPQIANAFPAVQMSDTGSFIRDDKFYTCGGGTAGIEMSLALIEQDYGARCALRLARELVVNLRPSGGEERQLGPCREDVTAEDRLAELPAWISSRLQARLSVEILAQRACVCPRHFSRLFKRAFHVTPAEFVEHLRVTEAARRLVSRQVTVDGVADSVGFKNADVFRRAFARRLGITPKKFQMQSRRHALPDSS